MSQANNNNRKTTIFICTFAIVFGIVFKLMPSFYYWQGQNAFKQEDYVQARKNFKNAVFFNPHNKDYRYYLVKSLENLSPSLTIQKEMFEIATGNMQDSAQQVAQNKVSEWQRTILTNIGDNYIEQVPLDKGILRWDTSKFPLTVAITDNSGTSTPAYYKTEILRAFSQWQSATGFITFATSKNSNSANISIEISQPPSGNCSDDNCKYVVGFTTPTYSGDILKQMKIVLYTNDPNGNFFSDKELYNTILHEIGHALGIMGHSYSTEDLMYMSTNENTSFYAPYRSSFQYLSSKDINTIRLLYKLVPTITNTPKKNLKTKGLIYAPIVLGTSNQISLRKLKEAQNYIKNAPDLAGGYIDMGIAYAELNRNAEAIRAMKKAYSLAKSDEEKFMICYNLSVILLNTNKLDSALSYAEEAQQITDNEDIKELISNIKHAKQTKKKPFNVNLLILENSN